MWILLNYTRRYFFTPFTSRHGTSYPQYIYFSFWDGRCVLYRLLTVARSYAPNTSTWYLQPTRSWDLYLPIKAPNSDPLAAARCYCRYWIDYLFDCDIRGNTSLPGGIVMIMKLENLQVSSSTLLAILSEKYAKWTRPMKVLICVHLYMMQSVSLSITD